MVYYLRYGRYLGKGNGWYLDGMEMEFFYYFVFFFFFFKKTQTQIQKKIKSYQHE